MLAILFATLLFTTADKPLELDGVVTFRRGFDPYYFVTDDEGFAWRVAETNRPVSVHAGDRIHVSGILPKNTAQRRLEKATVRKTGLGQVPSVRNMSVEDMYATALGSDDWYGSVVSVVGPVTDVNRRETYTQVLIGAKHRNVQVALPIDWNKPLPEGLQRGAIVRVQGVGVHTPVRAEKGDEVVGVENICVLPARFEDFKVISLPPFWTPIKVLGLCGTFFLALLVAVGWQLRKRRLERALADAARRERLRLTGELHDNFQQLLAGCMFLLGAAQGKVEKGDTEAAKGTARTAPCVAQPHAGRTAGGALGTHRGGGGTDGAHGTLQVRGGAHAPMGGEGALHRPRTRTVGRPYGERIAPAHPPRGRRQRA